MIQVQSPFGPGQILIVSGDLSRYPQFMQSLLKLIVPMGSRHVWASGTSIESNRNLALSKLSDDAQWIYTIDDDHTFSPDVLMKLLDRMFNDDRIDILQGLCVTRKPPYMPFAYMLDTEYTDYGVRYISATWDELPTSGVSEWDAVGTGGMLIRRKVVDAMKFPWFEAGRTMKDVIGEDLYFCKKAKDLGFRVWVDSDTRTGHMHYHENWAQVDGDGRWCLGLDMGNNCKLLVDRESWAGAKYEEIKTPVCK